MAVLTGCAHSRVAPEGFSGAVLDLDAAALARMRNTGSFKDGCPVPPERLVLLRFTHFTDAGGTAVGELVANRALAEDLLAIFADLYQQRFPIHSARPVDEFAADDDRSMAADNTSAFNCRPKVPAHLPDGTQPPTEYSLHSYGTAIDLNPVENPYFKPADLERWRAFAKGALPAALSAFCLQAEDRCTVLPPQGRPYLDRAAQRPGVLTGDSAAVLAFKRRGFRWGGDWPTSPGDKVRCDTQHFEKDPPR